MNSSRMGGILLHISALPGNQGIGSFGNDAFDFIDFMAEAGITLWQICPLGPTGYGDSPYQCFSAFAGNPLFIDLDELIGDGLLEKTEVEAFQNLPTDRVDYGALIPLKQEVFKIAFSRFRETENFTDFCKDNRYWLDDYAFFMALKDHFGGKAWYEWKEDIKLREAQALSKYRSLLHSSMQFHKFLQFCFQKQWLKIRAYAQNKSIQILGDMPIFVSLDSAEAWAKPELFQFDKDHNPIVVAGVPPDFFSPTGQLWGNPLYNWEKMKQDDFFWWSQRFRFAKQLVDLIRVDHFRGFSGYWAVPAGEPTAEKGSWQPASGDELFSSLQKMFGELPILAEDLGIITDEVTALREKFGFPGMKILQFAFEGGDNNPYLPQNYEENFAAYTGTHDNDTTKGWFESSTPEQQQRICEYLNCQENEVCDQMLRAIWNSKANFAIAPLQDFLELGSEARFNTPGVAGGNWQWRVKSEQLTSELKKKIMQLGKDGDRL